MHYAFDLWVKEWRQSEAGGEVYVVRYVDDFVLGFQYEGDARRFLEALKERLSRFHLELHPDKTRLIEFGRFATENRRRRGEGKPESFDFLGFTHHCAKTRAGRFRVGRKTLKKKATAKLRGLKAQLRQRMHAPIPEVGAWLSRVLHGHYNYYGVPGNSAAMEFFRDRLSRLWYTVLRRRSHKARLPWERMNRLLSRWLPRPRITHPWPEQRFDANTRGRSPVR